TAMLMKVHTSNFTMSGFTATVETEQLAGLTAEHGLILYEDLGSGALYDFHAHGIGEEPLVSRVIEKGTDLVTFSGDKLLGGPQAGIIAGKKNWIDALKKHQLARVLRVDKMTLAALEAIMKEYILGTALENIPTVRDISTNERAVKERAERFVRFAEEAIAEFRCEVAKDLSTIGGGTMPDVVLPTYGITIVHRNYTTQKLVEALRCCDPPVIARVKDEKVFLDFRTIQEDEFEILLVALGQLASNGRPCEG
ncbi:MAG TPA: L-seryl-tRNA(Sec) selenium transferase, partial [Bacillales bacterium]|nr:L-seryl-tRNA(Sec) selenium transferase [Bacillales bacterium]